MTLISAMFGLLCYYIVRPAKWCDRGKLQILYNAGQHGLLSFVPLFPFVSAYRRQVQLDLLGRGPYSEVLSRTYIEQGGSSMRYDWCAVVGT